MQVFGGMFFSEFRWRNSERRIPVKVFSPEIFKKARVQAGLSQFALGSRSGIAPAKISQIENGHLVPSLVKAAALAGALGLLVDDLLKEVD